MIVVFLIACEVMPFSPSSPQGYKGESQPQITSPNQNDHDHDHDPVPMSRCPRLEASSPDVRAKEGIIIVGILGILIDRPVDENHPQRSGVKSRSGDDLRLL